MTKANYENAEHNRFVVDMQTSRYKTFDYEGKQFWRGPGVRCKNRVEVGDVSGATRVKTIYEEDKDGTFVVRPASY